MISVFPAINAIAIWFDVKSKKFVLYENSVNKFEEEFS